MSGIKTINPANPGLKRPFRLSDLQNVWDGLTEALASETLNSATTIKIVSGLHIVGGILTPGVIAYKGKLYYYEGATSDNGGFSEGDDMYVAPIDDDDRTLSTGLVQPFYINNVIRNSRVNSGAIRIITNVTETVLSLFRYIPYVNGGAIVNNTITREKLVNGSVTTGKIAGEAVTTDKIESAAVTTDKIADAAVTTGKIANGAVGNAQIADGSVTPVKCDAAPFVRSGVTLFTGSCNIGVTGLFIVTLTAGRTNITFGPAIPGVVHVIARNTTSQAITVHLYGPTAVANFGSFSVPAGTQYAITTRFTTEMPNTVIEVKKLDFFQTFPVLD
jgi:hypothetical protein|nr:MAG TPA: hypothetical protein [Caudoviricetes sp.]